MEAVNDIEDQQQPQITLTKHLKQERKLGPLFTGGTFLLQKEGKRAFALRDNKICLFDLSTSEEVGVFSGEEKEEVVAFSIAHNGHFLGLCNKTGLVRVYFSADEFTSQQPFEQIIQHAVFKTNNQLALEITFDSSSQFLAIGTTHGQILVFDVKGKFQTHAFSGHRGVITELHFTPEKETLKLISAGDDRTLRVWDLVLKKELFHLRDGNQPPIKCLCFNQDGKIMVTADSSGELSFWNANEGFKVLATVGAQNEEEVNAMEYWAEKKGEAYLFFGGASGTLKVYDVAKKQTHDLSELIQGQDSQKQQAFSSQEPITHIILNSKTKELLVINQDQVLQRLKLLKEKSKHLHLELVETRCLFLDEIIDMKFLPPETGCAPSHAIICSNNDLLKLADLKSGAMQLYPGHSDIIICLDICPKAQLILSGAKDNEIRLWKWHEGPYLEFFSAFKGHNQTVSSVAFFPKKFKFFASVSQDNTVKVWPVPQSAEAVISQAQMTTLAHNKYINCVKVSPNDKIIATGSQDKTIKLWNASSLSTIATLSGHKKGVWDLAFSPVDRLLASASGDLTIKVWDIQAKTTIATLQGHRQAPVKALWINAGLQLLSASVDGLTKIWNISRQMCVTTLEMHEEKIWAVDVCDNFVVTGGGDSFLKLWQDNTIEQEQLSREQDLSRYENEQKLSSLMRNQDYLEAALLSFDLNKLRDFNFILQRLLGPQTAALDPINQILKSKENFLSFNQESKVATKSSEEQQMAFGDVMEALQAHDKAKLLQIIKNLGTKMEYARLSQVMLGYLLPKMDCGEWAEAMKEKQKSLQGDLQVIDLYCQKHYERADRGLKKAYYVDYVLSQMTLKEEIQEQKEKPGFHIPDMGSSQKKKKKRVRQYSDNLFTEEGLLKPLKRARPS